MTTQIVLVKQGNVQFEFDNGLKVSGFIGYGSYSDSTAVSKQWDRGVTWSKEPENIMSPNVEYAVFFTDGGAWRTHCFTDTRGDDVAGRRSIEEFLDVVNAVRKLTKEEAEALPPRKDDY